MTRQFDVQPGGSLRGRIRVPGDKSISHRSIMLGAIARGTTHVSGFLEGADALSTMNVFRALGVRIEGPDQGRVVVHGVGPGGLRAPTGPLDCGNAGTAMRLLIGLLAGQGFGCTLIGDESLSKRPMRRVADPLARMGARIHTQEGRPPVRIEPVEGALQAIDYLMPMASAQVKSSLLLAGLHALSRSEGATLFMTLLAAFKVLLYRYSGQTDLIVGTPIAGRNRREVEGLIGFFINTLALRGDLSGDPPFGELVGRVKRVALDAYAHADVPFEKLVEDLAPARSRAHSPLAQVLFVFHNEPRSALAPDSAMNGSSSNCRFCSFFV